MTHLGASADAETGSRERSQQAVSALTGFDPARRERPSTHGALLGEALSDLAKAGAVGTDGLALMCATCAFREGCMPNQMAATGTLALNCVLGIDPDDFACHHGMKEGQPTKLCAGYLLAKQAPFPVLQSALLTLNHRLATILGSDEVRADFDAWAAVHDPDGTMDDYARARAYSKALAAGSGTAETVQLAQCEASQSGGDSRNAQGTGQ